MTQTPDIETKAIIDAADRVIEGVFRNLENYTLNISRALGIDGRQLPEYAKAIEALHNYRGALRNKVIEEVK